LRGSLEAQARSVGWLSNAWVTSPAMSQTWYFFAEARVVFEFHSSTTTAQPSTLAHTLWLRLAGSQGTIPETKTIERE
jgi:hypothetical protein